MPRIVACGGRRKAYEDFCTAVRHNERAMLLVDSESPVNSDCQTGNDPARWDPWQHLNARQGDGWEMPDATAVTDCHLMVQCMETWFLADEKALKRFYGKDFNERALPAQGNAIETIDKQQVYQILKDSTKKCKKGTYSKSDHSFELLTNIDPGLVVSASPWAKRFIDQLREKQAIP
jgi:hypothetical protein